MDNIKHKELENKADQLIELINDSKLGIESKTNILYDLEYSMTKIVENIVFKDFRKALDKLKGLRQAIDIGQEFRTLINEMITGIEEMLG